MMPAARLICQRPPSNFPYFRTSLANFLLSRPNSVEYGNSKTTTLLPSAKCTRPLFQGRTGCGGRPSSWHDIVICQRLVYICLLHARNDNYTTMPKVFINHHFFITRHSLVCLLYVFLFFCSVNDFSTTHGPIRAKVCIRAYCRMWMCLLPFWGLAATGGRKRGDIKFSLLWDSVGNFCMLVVFERYLSNACTDPHHILFV